MPTYLTPGVYFERAEAVVPAITALRTDIAGFVGIAERGPLHRAVPVQSWRQFLATFGNFTGTGYLAYAAKGFFENGGRKCYVVRVADHELAAPAAASFKTNKGGESWRIAASSAGGWGDQLAVQVRATHRAQTRTVVDLSLTDGTASRVMSVAHFEPATLVRLYQPGATPVQALRVVASVDGNRQRIEWKDPLAAPFAMGVPIFIESVEYTLTVSRFGHVVAIYDGLSVVAQHPRYVGKILGVPYVPRGDTRPDVVPPPPSLIIIQGVEQPIDVNELLADTERPLLLMGGRDGLETLAVDDFIGEPDDLLASDEERERKRRGLRALEAIDEVSLVAVPDIHIRPMPPPRLAPTPPPTKDICSLTALDAPASIVPPVFPELPPLFSDEDIFRVQSALVAHCEDLRDRLALLDPPFSAAGDEKLGEGAIVAWRSRFESKYAALYYPWLQVVDPLRLGGQVLRALPPSGHVAGMIARTDLEIGVHKAPANARLEWTEDTTAAVGDETQAGLNPLGINAIRVFRGRGIYIYGTRTVCSDSAWIYVNVRRLLMMIEEALDVSTQWVVFEPNDVYTRGKVLVAITTFLEMLWRKGALSGTQPEEAFYVKCDDDNNPPFERENGRLHVEVGVAPSVPYEFVVLRIGRTTEELEILEQS